jgi:hypothetical protein
VILDIIENGGNIERTNLGVGRVYAFTVVHCVIIHSLPILVNLPINTTLCHACHFTVPIEPTTISF